MCELIMLQKSILKSGKIFSICHDLYLAGYRLCVWYRKPIFGGSRCQASECHQMNYEVPMWYYYSWSTSWTKPTKHIWRHSWSCIVIPMGQVEQMVVNQQPSIVFLLGQRAISWDSKKQPTVALPSMEVEYMASTNAMKEAIPLQQLCKDIIVLQQLGQKIIHF